MSFDEANEQCYLLNRDCPCHPHCAVIRAMKPKRSRSIEGCRFARTRKNIARVPTCAVACGSVRDGIVVPPSYSSRPCHCNI